MSDTSKNAALINRQIGQIDAALNMQFLNFALMGAKKPAVDSHALAAWATALASSGLTWAELEGMATLHEQLCQRIRAGMTLAEAVAAARAQEPGCAVFNRLLDATANRLELGAA
jgi:hypothetical protein